MVTITVDRNIYSDEVITKAVYWETGNYCVSRKLVGTEEEITFQPNPKFSEKESLLRERFVGHLNDFKLRQIVNHETKDIRTILYIKAFAHNDDFEEMID